MRLRFLGAARQVTGSRYLLEAGGLKVLVDCGLYQERDYLSRNWDPFPVPPGEIDYVVLTHAHLDHSGLIPRLVKGGFNGTVVATRASVELAEIVLRDAGHLQEEDARHKKRRHEREGRKAKYPEEPLYTEQDAQAAMGHFRAVRYDEWVELGDHVTVRFRDAGHILGSAMLELQVSEKGEERTLVFSGDIGQWDKALVRDPTLFTRADYVVMESTYGDRNHRDEGDVEELLGKAINETVEAGGNLLIPTFAIERAQELLYHMSRLIWQDRIPHLLAFLDSPMAVNATDVFLRYPECLDEETHELMRSHRHPFAFPGLKLVRSVEESKSINRIRGSCIIMAGSGMCTGGRIKHHLEHRIARPENTVLFVGYQARGTLGRHIIEGADEVRIHGQNLPVRAQVKQIHGFSAHADQRDLLRWLNALTTPPRTLFVTHGEPEVSETFAARVRHDFGWETVVPEYDQICELE